MKISQHLAYLKERKMVTGHRHQQWIIYSVPADPSPELEANLKCLQDCVQSEPVFKADRRKLKALMGDKSVRALLDEGCCFLPKGAKSQECCAE